jgi:hypothetical protein
MLAESEGALGIAVDVHDPRDFVGIVSHRRRDVK